MKTRIGVAAVLAVGSMMASLAVAVAGDAKAGPSAVERGRYLVTIGGCNDCHTPGFMQNGLKVSEKEWLTGNEVGFQGPWGTTFPANLRLIAGSSTETEWMVRARKERLPPMPSYVLQTMKDDDLRAIYAYIRSLGPAGVAAPAYVAPGGRVDTPYFVFVPVVDQKQAARR
jgi:mono/diheme cytochrome c family protein